MATIFVTGGAGYLGSRLCARLAAAGHLPVTYDNLAEGSVSAVQSGPLVLGDLLDRERLDEALALYAPDAVVHLAATRDEAPDRRYANDVGGSLSLLEAMQSRGVSSIVFASSTDAGGEGAPADAAATAKRIVEQMLEDAGHAYGIRSVVLRLPRLVDQTGEDGLPVLGAADAVVEAIDHLAGGGASVVRALGQGPAPERNRSVA